MARMAHEGQEYVARYPHEERGAYEVRRGRESGGLSLTWLLTGAAVVGLGALAWYHFGADLRRYLKIKSM